MRALALIVAIAFWAAVSPFASAAPEEGKPRELLLEVWLNGQSREVAVTVAEKAGVLWVERKDLVAIGIKDVAEHESDGGQVALSRLSGVRASIEESKQQLMITAAAERLAPTILDLRRGYGERPVVSGTPVSAFVLDYDVVATETDVTSSLRKSSLDGALQASAFTPFGTFVTNGFVHVDQDESNALRLDTSWTLDDPAELRRLTVGDTISGGTRWSRSVRFGGVQLARDFSLQPDLITMPLPDFFGEAAVPGSVDVFVGASKVASEDVPAGPFDVRDLPVVTGGGEATVIVRDLLGREVTKTISFFGDSRMLAEGLTSYSVDAGFLRRSYGEKSFDYGDAMVSATLRHGLYDALTVEAHAEATENVAMVGVGGVVSLLDFGSLALAGAGSTSEFGAGVFGSAMLQADFGPLNLFASLELSTPAYRDIAAFEGSDHPREMWQVGAGLEFGDYGNMSLSFLRVEQHDKERTTLATATYSVAVGDGVTFGVTSVYDAERDSLLAETFLSVPLGENGPRATATLRTQEQDTEVRAILEDPVSGDGGFGYRLQASHGETNRFDAEGRWLGQNLALSARAASADGNVTAQLQASGAIVAADDAVFLARKLDGAFALVDAGEPGVRIYRENRLMAEANEDGKALLTGLTPFSRNRIAIAPGDYDMSRILTNTDLEVVPGRGGTAISLAPSDLKPVMLTVTMPDGSFPAAGTTVRFAGTAEPWIVGHSGGVFVQDLKLPLEVTVETKLGLCRLVLSEPPVAVTGEIPHIGPIACGLAQ